MAIIRVQLFFKAMVVFSRDNVVDDGGKEQLNDNKVEGNEYQLPFPIDYVVQFESGKDRNPNQGESGKPLRMKGGNDEEY